MWRALGLACSLLLALPASAQEGAQEAPGAKAAPGEQPAPLSEAAPPEAGQASAPGDAQKSICLLLELRNLVRCFAGPGIWADRVHRANLYN